jgi:hypothetical protein
MITPVLDAPEPPQPSWPTSIGDVPITAYLPSDGRLAL